MLRSRCQQTDDFSIRQTPPIDSSRRLAELLTGAGCRLLHLTTGTVS